jgi:hypothetical protein
MLISKASAAWDVYAFGIPLLGLLFFGFFKLDEVFTGRKPRKPTLKKPPPPVERSASQMRNYELAMQSDPDGRKWDDRRTTKR